MGNVLMYISNGLIIVSFILYFIMIFVFDKEKVSKNNAFNITKDMISEYNTINLIESNGYFTFYNIKRKVIKLASKCYYGNDVSSISVALIEAGISVVDSCKNKYIDMFRKLFSNFKILYIFPLLVILINSITYNMADVKLGIIFIILFLCISYMIIDIKGNSIEWINNKIINNKDVSETGIKKVIGFTNRVLLFDKQY